ncbi:MAG: type 4a pilus biogenesis protein PilO [Armatimonadetes bacterium]|nr:type 4a pilus biogenesis protein PilO [Armatimonadota bacterium]
MKFSLTPKTFYALTGIVVVVGSAMLWMTNSTNSDQKAHIESISKEVRDEKEVQKELADSKKVVEDLQFKLKHLEEGVQQFAYIPTMMKELEQYGKQNQIQVVQIKPVVMPTSPKDKDKNDDKKKSAYEEMNVNIKCRGSYEDSLRFLQAIKVFPKIVAVRTVSLSPHTDNKTKKAAKPVLDLELELRAYAFKDDANITPVASSGAKGGSNES